MNDIAPTSRAALLSRQLDQLRKLVAAVARSNPFQCRKLAECRERVEALARLEDFSAQVPVTTKEEMVADQEAHPPYGTNLTYPLEHYTRCHQTSGTTSSPLRWLDTPESWNGMVESWMAVHRAAGVGARDRVFFAFSFGPFIGFWMAFEAAERLGALCVPGGGLGSVARLRTILDQAITILCCTPTYGLHLAEVAAREGLDLTASKVRRVIVAGEPGGSIPGTRARLERSWPGARVFDHHGMTEVGPVTYECPSQPGVLHLLESAYYAEVIDPLSTHPVAPGTAGELLLTTLGRTGSPLLRYRTGDLVRPRFSPSSANVPPCRCGSFELALEGGILGRVDDMIIVRGVNVFPTAVEAILRGFVDVAEYRVTVTAREQLTEMRLEVEPAQGCAEVAALIHRLERAFEVAFSLRVPITAVAVGGLPRFEMKAKRWVRAPRTSGEAQGPR